MENDNLVGFRIGVIQVIGMGKIVNSRRMYECHCDSCGSTFYQSKGNIIHRLKGFGCKNCKNSYFKTHGMKYEKIYNVWKQMKHRCDCTESDYNHYKNYGGRGVKICDEWKNDFITFYNWAIANGWNENDLYKSGRNKLTIDRINNNGDYEPSNCRIITHRQNQWNKRTTKYIDYYGTKYALAELSEKLDLTTSCLRERIKNWDISRWDERPQRRETK